MTQELLYTSAPRGLKPGIKGFCTVASTAGMAPTLADRLESLSGYKHLFPPHDRQAQLNPVLFSHLILKVGGQTLHVLSRICDAGLDYSQRSNKFAHHVALAESELAPAGPAWVLSQPGFMETDFAGDPRILAAGRKVPRGDAPPRVCQAWESLAGDAGWAGVLAEAALGASPKTVNIIYRPGTDVLALVHEALALVPAARRWGVTFSTYYTKLPPGLDCQWRFLVDGEAEAKTARRTPQTLLIDLCSQLGPAEGGPLVAAARTGILPEPAAPEAAPIGHFSPGPNVAAAPFLTRVEQPSAREPASRPTPAHEWPTSSPTLIQRRRKTDMKRLAVGGAKVLVIALLIAGAAVLGELHGRGVLRSQNSQVVEVDPAKPGPLVAADSAGSSESIPAPPAPAKGVRPVIVESTGSEPSKPASPSPTPGSPSTPREQTPREPAKATGSSGDSENRTRGKPAERKADDAPTGDAASYRKELAAFSQKFSNVVDVMLPGTERTKVQNLNVPVRPGIRLELNPRRAKSWDPDLTELSLNHNDGSSKWTVHRIHATRQSADIAEFDTTGKTLIFNWSNTANNFENLRDCFLTIESGDGVAEFSLRPRQPVAPINVMVTLDHPDVDAKLEKLEAPRRAWPDHGKVLVSIKCLLPGFRLFRVERASQKDTLVEWTDPELNLELQDPQSIDPIYAMYKANDELCIRFVPELKRLNDKVYRFGCGTKLLVAEKFPFDPESKPAEQEAGWQALNNSQKTDLGRVSTFAKNFPPALTKFQQAQAAFQQAQAAFQQAQAASQQAQVAFQQAQVAFQHAQAELQQAQAELQHAQAELQKVLNKFAQDAGKREGFAYKVNRLVKAFVDAKPKDKPGLLNKIKLFGQFCDDVKEAKALLEFTISLKEPAD